MQDSSGDWEVIEADKEIQKKQKNQDQFKIKKNLGFTDNPIMDDRKIDILSQEISKDWYIHETITYQIFSYDKKSEYKVSRRYSDFQWLYEEIRFQYPGYLISQTSEKNPFSKIDLSSVAKVEIFEKQKQIFLNNRKKSLKIFIQKLLEHSELKYSGELISFLILQNEEFNLFKVKSDKVRNEYMDKQGLISNIFSGISTGIYSVFTYITGNRNQKIRKKDKIDEEFDQYYEFYKRQRMRLNEVYESFSHTYIKIPLQQSEIYYNFAQKLQNQSEQQDNFNIQFSNIYDQIAFQLVQCSNQMSENIEIYMKEHLRHFDSVLLVIKEREQLSEDIFQNHYQVESMEGIVDYEEQMEILKKKIQTQIQRQQKLINNFRFDKKEFDETINKQIKNLNQQFEILLQENAQMLKQKWEIQIKY